MARFTCGDKRLYSYSHSEEANSYEIKCLEARPFFIFFIQFYLFYNIQYQEKTSEQSTRLKIFGPWRLPLLSLVLVVEHFEPGRKKSETAKKQCMLNLIYLQLYPDLSKPSVLRSSLLDAQVNNKQRRNNVF